MDDFDDPDDRATPQADPWYVSDVVREVLTLDYLRPFALRVLGRLLMDDEVPIRLRLDAAKLVIDKTREGEKPVGDEATIDAELETLVEAMRRRG